MATIVGISGPSCTGKTTLAGLLSSRFNNNPDVVVLEDFKDEVWRDLVSSTSFSQFEEVYSDRDYLMMYCSKCIIRYKSLIKEYKGAPEEITVIMDGTHIDLLIYMMLQFWYHYPSHELLGQLVSDTLALRDMIDVIYMTKEDDERYDPTKSKSLRQRMTDFKRSRSLEVSYYDMFGKLNNVVLLSADVSLGEYEVVNDLISKGYVREEVN